MLLVLLLWLLCYVWPHVSGFHCKGLISFVPVRGPLPRFVRLDDSPDDAVVWDEDEDEFAEDNDLQAVRFNMTVSRLMANLKNSVTAGQQVSKLDEEKLQLQAQQELKMLLRHMDFSSSQSDEEDATLAQKEEEERKGSVRTKRGNRRGKLEADDFESRVAASPNAMAEFNGSISGSFTAPDRAVLARERLFAALEKGPPTHCGPTCKICKRPASTQEIADFGKCSFCRGEELQDGGPSAIRRRFDVKERAQQDSKEALTAVVEMSKLAEDDIFLFLADKCRELLPDEGLVDFSGDEVEVGKRTLELLIADVAEMRRTQTQREKTEERLTKLEKIMDDLENRMKGIMDKVDGLLDSRESPLARGRKIQGALEPPHPF